MNKMTLGPLEKCPTGIEGLDELLNGGLPRGRPTLVCGSAGCGKTLLAMEFLVRGAVEFGEPGVFMAFEENGQELAQNVASLGFDLPGLIAAKKVAVDFVSVAREEIEATGEYDLEGLFIRLDHAINSVGAKRVVLDTVESLFSGLPHPMILRGELRRLFRWLKERGVTVIITGERGEGSLTRQGLEEYVSDCVILLDHRIVEQISTRRLRVVKYRGSTHGTNEYPFLIGEKGFSVLPITSLGLQHVARNERVSTGVPRLDAMLGGNGYYRGSTVLVSGTAGCGKTSLAAHFVDAACARGERALLFAFEESPSQIVRNMRSIGIDLQPAVDAGLLQFHAARPAMHGLEMHLAAMLRAIDEFEPAVVVVDPASAFVVAGNDYDVKAMMMRLVDYLKTKGITALFCALTAGEQLESSDLAISSLIDTWLLLRVIDLAGERNRALYLLKSRGMWHSNQIREFVLTDQGVDLVDVYVGPAGVLTGSGRMAQEAAEKAATLARQQEIGRRRRDLERKRLALEAQIAALRVAFEAEEAELEEAIRQGEDRESVLVEDRVDMARLRHADQV